MSNDNRRFAKGSGSFVCGCCGKHTRESGTGNSFVSLYPYCIDEALLENALSDGSITQKYFDGQIISIKKKHGRM
jgi:hypothetical protein